MNDFFKYLTTSDADKEWGIFLTVAGRASIGPHSVYPPPQHPSTYHFTWSQWRTLQEYQLNYITQGEGVLETPEGQFPVKTGSLILIRPGIKHRYKPLAETGWTENYVGFQGPLAIHFMQQGFLASSLPILSYGIREDLVDIYYRIMGWVQREQPGYQQVSSGLVIQLLGLLGSLHKQKNFKGKRMELLIQQACRELRNQVDSQVDLRSLADSHHIGYSYFRKRFKTYTGMSPHQYFMELKIVRAKELILTTDRSIKEISFDLNFSSIHYFSRLFKQRTGCSPSAFRKK